MARYSGYGREPVSGRIGNVVLVDVEENILSTLVEDFRGHFDVDAQGNLYVFRNDNPTETYKFDSNQNLLWVKEGLFADGAVSVKRQVSLGFAGGFVAEGDSSFGFPTPVRKYDGDGELEWENEYESDVDGNVTSVFFESSTNSVYIGFQGEFVDGEGGLEKVDAVDGSRIWKLSGADLSFTDEAVNSIVANENYVYVGTDDRLWRIDATTGEVLNSVATSSGGPILRLADNGDVVVTGF